MNGLVAEAESPALYSEYLRFFSGSQLRRLRQRTPFLGPESLVEARLTDPHRQERASRHNAVERHLKAVTNGILDMPCLSIRFSVKLIAFKKSVIVIVIFVLMILA